MAKDAGRWGGYGKRCRKVNLVDKIGVISPSDALHLTQASPTLLSFLVTLLC